MSIAAVPHYLQDQDFSTASPALRFGMYLKLWGTNRRSGERLWGKEDIDHAVRGQLQQERELPLDNKATALKAATRLTPNDKHILRALEQRQQHLAQTLDPAQLLTLDALATAPFTTGLGNEHPLENGFAFLNPYGLPYLPGSGTKGVLRNAARELASGEWGESAGWTQEKNPRLLQDKPARTIALSPIDVLFGLETQDGASDHVRGVLTFWDTVPHIGADSLQVEIMTPHQGDYYQQKSSSDRKSSAVISPHDSGQPTIIQFLTVPAGSRFGFHVQCNLSRLERLAPELADNGRWKQLLTAAFEHAFEWLGFGAKTAVGYGAMHKDHAAEKRRSEAQQQKAQAVRMASFSPAMQTIEAFVQELRAKHTQYPTFKEKANGTFHTQARALAKTALESTDWTAEEKHAAALSIEQWLPLLVQVDMKDERKKLKLTTLKGL